MEFTHRSRIHNQIISRRRTQLPTKKIEAEVDTRTSGNTGNNTSGQKTSTEQDVGRNTQRGMDKAN